MEEVERCRQLLESARDEFAEDRRPEKRAALIGAIAGFEEEVSAHVDGAYLRQLLSTARQSLQDEESTAEQTSNALIDLDSALLWGREGPAV